MNYRATGAISVFHVNEKQKHSVPAINGKISHGSNSRRSRSESASSDGNNFSVLQEAQ